MKSSATTPAAEALSRRALIAGAGLGVAGAALLTGHATTPVMAAPAPAAGDARLPWPARAAFASKVVIGPHQASAAAMLDDRPLLGLPREGAFFYGNLRDADGNLSEWVRRFPGATPGGLEGMLVQSSAGKDTLHMLPELFMAAASSAGFVASMSGGDGVWTSAPGAKGKPFRVTMSADGQHASWSEAGVLDVTGRLLGPGLQWHIPDAAGSQLYVSQIYQMQGTALGKTVRGIMAFDQNYLPSGVLLYSGKDPLFRPLQHHRTWYTWGTRYKDGSFDAGHFVLGTDRMGFALLTNERQDLTLDTDVTGEVTLMPDGIWPKRIVLRTGAGVQWEFLPDPKGRMPDLLGGKVQAVTPQQEGRWRRVGDRREPDVWFAWGEVAAGSGRTAYTREYRV